MFYLGRPWGKGAKIDANEKRDDGYWDGGKFVKCETPEDKLAEFNESLKQARTYYQIFKKHHTSELPKTNYDLVKEESQTLGMTEI